MHLTFARLAFVASLFTLLLAVNAWSDDTEKKTDERARVRARRYLRRVKSVGTKEVKLRLIADVESVAPGKAFRVGIHFTMGKGWHIYSHKKGEGYLPTKVELKVPAGYQIVKTEWPKVEQIDGFPAYHKAVMATAWIKPTGKSAAGKPLQINADASWQFCHEDGVCRLGKGAPSVTLKPGEGKPSHFAALFPVAKTTAPNKR